MPQEVITSILNNLADQLSIWWEGEVIGAREEGIKMVDLVGGVVDVHKTCNRDVISACH
jgi:hypothetical protein